MFSDFFNRFNSISEECGEQTAQEGLILAVIMTMYADHKIQSEEQDELDTILKKAEWNSGISINHFLSNTYTLVRDAIEKKDYSKVVSTIDEKITNIEFKNKTIRLCKSIANSDEELHESEKSFIEELEKLNVSE